MEIELGPPCSPFMLIKPEGGRFMPEIRSLLTKYSINIEAVFFVPDWEAVSREIYLDQLDSFSDSQLLVFNAHIYANLRLYGNHGIVLILHPPSGTTKTGSMEVIKAKHAIRESLNDPTIQVVVRAKGIMAYMMRQALMYDSTTLSSTYSCSPEINYVHTPDSLERVKEEYNILLRYNVIKNKNIVTMQEYEMLCVMRTTNALSKVF